MERPYFLSQDGAVLRGRKRVVTVSNPAAGAEWSVTVPGGVQWRVPTLRWRYVASAVVASRFTNLDYTVDGVVIFEAVNISAVTASQTVPFTAYHTAVSANSATQNASSTFPIPFLWLPQGSAVGSRTPNMDVGDQYSQIALYVEEAYGSDQEIDASWSGDK